MLGRFKDKVEAAIVRDSFVVNNKLPHTLNFTIEEIKAIKAKYSKLARELERNN
jgi:hypothetical protein